MIIVTAGIIIGRQINISVTKGEDGHIPGAINVANEDITDTPPAELPDKNQTIYVHCRSGRRSKEAAFPIRFFLMLKLQAAAEETRLV